LNDFDVEVLQDQISDLTQRLKSMMNTDPGYRQLWDRRAELKGYLREALKEQQV
jgi:hypothetical protein